ncbi:elongation factor G [Natronoglycomyces albus]|uniref:TetM/TetW/TetO/TetS family tetracycline resistance ribosomal protection protein n=1 Tax=Natronoglycomyces albus TaxID=2811108 RepID=A0A895XVX8_9ACTN|nr:TetM/TetW/TetO/TetS family tetracycline resistance ribosomal protection protein [Natronoglycomyces albus]QSB06686.1 TetM/TetW/TetO/TetS family tetracycline resistance ribosomal protection protein [Natronoglycomyces albus]
MTSILNLGILAHVDAGKTSLTERLLLHAGAIKRAGSVDAGDTHTDSLALERQRGITIKSAVVSFTLGEVTVNLIDTPGHPDFIAEVERVLSVLDGAVLVVSAVEGVQPQTRILLRTLRRLAIPTLIFVNKIDRLGARYSSLLSDIATKLSPGIVPMGVVENLGQRDADFVPFAMASVEFASELSEKLADHSDEILAAVVEQTAMSSSQLHDELAAQTARCHIIPVYFGSAYTGAGVEELSEAITTWLPTSSGQSHEPVSGTVFKVERAPSGQKIAYARLFSGTIRVRERLRFASGREARITGLRHFEDGTLTAKPHLSAGQIGQLLGCDSVRIGDWFGQEPPRAAQQYFPPPTLEAVVVPKPSTDVVAVRQALSQIAEQDPLINLRQREDSGEVSVSLYGEVQKEVIQSTLLTDFGLEVGFREATTICIERPTGSGAAAQIVGEESNPFPATVGLRIDPAPVGTGIQFRLEVELGSMPSSFFRAVEDGVMQTLRQGLYGWQVTDCVVTVTHSSSAAPANYASDFRLLAPLVVMSALKRAGTAVFEPMDRFLVEAPSEALETLIPGLGAVQAVPDSVATRGVTTQVKGIIPSRQVGELTRQLPDLAGGEGMLETEFDHHREVRRKPPSRPRTDYNPLNRTEYLMRLAGTIAE